MVAFMTRCQVSRLIRSNFSTSQLIDSGLLITRACKIKSLQQAKSNDNIKLRIMVDSGGCSGFQYKFQIVDDEPDEENDRIFNQEGATVIVDTSSLDLIKGATVDYQQELIKSAFIVTNNPQSEAACGCGSSFAVKAFTSNPAVD